MAVLNMNIPNAFQLPLIFSGRVIREPVTVLYVTMFDTALFVAEKFA